MARDINRGNVAQSESASPLIRSSLREQIKDVILRRIVEGVYQPGERLVETRIAQEINVSQSSVREALRDLEHIGAVVYEPYRGCSVRRLSIAELIEAFPVRAALESLAASLAADRASEQEFEELTGAYNEMAKAAATGQAHALSQADADFHALIVHASGNATLERQWASLEPYSRTFITVSRRGTDLLQLVEEHRPILDALKGRDADRAAQVVREHLLHAGELLAASAVEPGGTDP